MGDMIGCTVGKALGLSVTISMVLFAATAGGGELSSDIAMERAELEAAKGQHRAALAILEEFLVLRTEQDPRIPAPFWFLHAQAASGAAEYALAVDSARRYVAMAGPDGEHHAAALELLGASERLRGALLHHETEEREREERRQATEANAVAKYRALRKRLSATTHQDREFADALQSGGYGPAMVRIPAGKFLMGCESSADDCDDRDKPLHEVTIARPFALSAYEVTYSEFDACVEDGVCSKRIFRDQGWGGGTRPVIHVSWKDAQDYLAWLTEQTGAEYRLPSEAEWEYAARAGTSTRYSWGDDVGTGRANCGGCGSPWDWRQTAPVGSFRPNGFGLYDVHGNVAEFVADCWNDSYQDAPSDGSAWLQGDCSKRVLRGGLWSGSAQVLSASFRIIVPVRETEIHADFIGLRVARTLGH